MKTLKIVFLVFAGLLLTACGSDESSLSTKDPVNFERSDECHVCGMVITKFAGPKGQAFDSRGELAKKFCSTKEMIIWYLQPENTHNVKAIYVHDMTKAPWESPNDEHLISARDAYYVVGSDLKGSMGSTLATFLSVNDAAKFAKDHGGEVLSFNGLTLELLSKN